MKKVISALGLICLIVGLSSCAVNINGAGLTAKTLTGDKNIVNTETVLTDEVYTLQVEDIIFTGSNSVSPTIIIDESLDDVFTLTTDNNIADTITISVSDNKITVRGDDSQKYKFTEFEIRIGAKVEDCRIEGGFEVKVDQPSLTKFSGLVNGAVDADMTFGQLESFSMNVNGACDVTLKGETETSSIVVNGAGSINAFDFHAVNNTVNISGAGDCKVYASDTLDIEMNGVGTVVYDGNPQTVNKGSNMLGSISKR